MPEIIRPSVDLPQPDSPTRPSVSPRSIVSDTLSTACTGRVSTGAPKRAAMRSPSDTRGRNIFETRSTLRKAALMPRAPSPDDGSARRAYRRRRAADRWRRARPPFRSASRRGTPAADAERRRRPRNLRRLASGSRARGQGAEQSLGVGMTRSRSTRAVGPSSTSLPAYMTAMRSASDETVARSWLIQIIAAPVSRTRPRISVRICAWIETSSAVVGSSATMTSGSCSSAMAMATRWRIPPENWCG